MPNPVVIQIKRGLKADLPILNDGELGYCTDTHEIFVGYNGVNIPTVSVYVHPTTHPASMIEESSDRVFLSATEKTFALKPKEYVHSQTSSSSVWTIPHGLGRRPRFTVIDSAGTNIDGAIIEYVSLDILRLTFSAEFSGTAYLS